MRKLLTTSLIYFTFISGIWSQQLDMVDQKVMSYKKFRSPEKLAEQLNEDFSTDLEKARAIFTWIAINIEYDVETFLKGTFGYSYTYRNLDEKRLKEEQHKKSVAYQTFKKKLAVCEGYSNLYQILCELTGVESTVIDGYSKTRIRDIGRNMTEADHAWNAVKVDGKWLLIDATWGAGHVEGNFFMPDFDLGYFNTNPNRFDLNHYPKDAKWLFSDITKKEFVGSPLFYSPYMSSNMKFESPMEGVIEILGDEEITIKVRSDSVPEHVTYNFARDKYASYLKFEKVGEFYLARVPAPKNKSSSLTLYYKNQGIVSYKLVY